MVKVKGSVLEMGRLSVHSTPSARAASIRARMVSLRRLPAVVTASLSSSFMREVSRVTW